MQDFSETIAQYGHAHAQPPAAGGQGASSVTPTLQEEEEEEEEEEERRQPQQPPLDGRGHSQHPSSREGKTYLRAHLHAK